MWNASFQADWQFIKERKQRIIIQNNKRENAKRKPHTYNVGDVVVVKAGAGCKHGSNPYLNPMRITQVNHNGTVKLVKVADNNGGAVSQTWNIRNIELAKLRLRDSKALERLQILHSKPSTSISQLTYWPLSWGMLIRDSPSVWPLCLLHLGLPIYLRVEYRCDSSMSLLQNQFPILFFALPCSCTQQPVILITAYPFTTAFCTSKFQQQTLLINWSNHPLLL